MTIQKVNSELAWYSASQKVGEKYYTEFASSREQAIAKVLQAIQNDQK